VLANTHQKGQTGNLQLSTFNHYTTFKTKLQAKFQNLPKKQPKKYNQKSSMEIRTTFLVE